jgi:hypothetical protein
MQSADPRDDRLRGKLPISIIIIIDRLEELVELPRSQTFWQHAFISHRESIDTDRERYTAGTPRGTLRNSHFAGGTKSSSSSTS